MAYTGVRALTYAKVASGGDGTPIVYNGGKMLTNYLCRMEITEERANDNEYADNSKIDSDNSMTGVGVNVELAHNSDDIKKDLLGYVEEAGDLIITEDAAPFVGIGAVIAERFQGVMSYEGVWTYKTQFASAGITAETKRESTNFGHETLNGNGMIVKNSAEEKGRAVARHTFSDEADAIAWLKTKAGIAG